MGREHDTALAALVARQHSIFTTTHARSFGLTRRQIQHRIATGQWQSIHDGVYRLAGVRPTWQGDVLAACWAGGFRAFASHRSAAALWNLAGGRRWVVEVTCPRWRRVRHGHLVVHESTRIEGCDVTSVDGVPASTPERTLFDLGGVCSESVVEIALDAAERRGLVTSASLQSTLRRLAAPGHPGSRVLRAVLDRRYPGRLTPESEMETTLIQALRRHGLPDPVVQYSVRDDSGQFVARVDLAYPGARIAVEYDSAEWHSGRMAIARDAERRSRLLALGWTPFTATVDEIRRGASALSGAISVALRRAS